MERFRAFLRNPFSFMFATTKKEERIVQYVIREHDRGRSLDDILDDPYVKNRLTEQERSRLMERPDLIHALAEDMHNV